MRHRQNGMVFLVLALALFAPLLQVGAAMGENGLGRITGAVNYTDSERPPVSGFVVIYEAYSALEVAKVPVVNSSFDSGEIPPGTYRIGFDVGDFYFYHHADPSCFVDSATVIVLPDETISIQQDINWQDPVLLALNGVEFTGRVLDGQEQPLPNIEVTLIDSCTAMLIDSESGGMPITTDEKGLFTATVRTIPGDFRLRFSDPRGNYSSGYCPSIEGDQTVVDKFIDGRSFDRDYINTDPKLLVVVLKWGALDLAPAALSFGEVALPGSKNLMITASNVSTGPLTITGIDFTGGSSDFSLSSAWYQPVILEPGQHIDISLTYTPHALGPAAETTLEISANTKDSTAHLLTVKLNGTGVVSTALPAEQIIDTVNFIEGSVAQGTLTGTGPTGAANAKVEALINQITSAGDMAAKGQSKAACQQLLNAMRRTDGNPQPPDFVEGPAATELTLLIQTTLQQMGCN